jgi:hypothetical protein
VYGGVSEGGEDEDAGGDHPQGGDVGGVQ